MSVCVSVCLCAEIANKDRSRERGEENRSMKLRVRVSDARVHGFSLSRLLHRDAYRSTPLHGKTLWGRYVSIPELVFWPYGVFQYQGGV